MDSDIPNGLVDVSALALWMVSQGLDRGPITDLEMLAGGTQNAVIRFNKGGRDFILRRPPPAPRAESNRTMQREARVLGALAQTSVPHPRLIAACHDLAVLGVCFYLMEPVDGFNATSGPLPPLHAGDPLIRREMGFAIVDGAAALAGVDHVAVGLADFGRHEGFLERQVGRWQSQLESYAQYDAWPGVKGLPDVAAIGRYLQDNIPPHFEPGILHGDYSLGNVMYSNSSAGLAAIIDWELATIGDPLLDLGWLLATWRGVPPIDLSVLVVSPWDGFPSTEELIARYAARSRRDLSHIGWYAVLASYKLAIILEGTYARACAGIDPMATGISLHDTATKLLLRALYRISH